MVLLTDYERERQERIAKNKAILASLDIPKAKSSTPRRPPQSAIRRDSNKRKRRVSSLERDLDAQSGERPQIQRRLSARLQKIVCTPCDLIVLIDEPRRKYDDSDDDTKSKRRADSDYSSQESSEDEFEQDATHDSNGVDHPVKNGLSRRTVNGRNVVHIDKTFDRPNPKAFGEIPGVVNGKWWATRMEASRDGCHAPTVAGISGNEKEGCWSIALSGGYEDDVDEGYCFTYTGSGGRNLKGTKANPKNLRTAPQSSDQTLTGLNLALKVSCETARPIRVIRGFKGHSKWAPSEGYRYIIP